MPNIVRASAALALLCSLAHHATADPLSSRQLNREVTEDLAGAQARYQGRNIEVQGPVRTITRRWGNTGMDAVRIFGLNEDIVLCFVDDASSLPVKPGEQAIVSGRAKEVSNTFTGNGVWIEPCQVRPAGQAAAPVAAAPRAAPPQPAPTPQPAPAPQRQAQAARPPQPAPAGDCVAVTAMDLFNTRGNNAAMATWQNKTVCVSGGTFGGNSGSSVNVNATPSSDHTVECDVGGDLAGVAEMRRNQPVAVRGTVTRVLYGFSGRFQLSSCSVTAGAMPKQAARKAAPPNPPMGTYQVHQGMGFGRQYEFKLQAGGRYTTDSGRGGSYSYDSASKVLRFSGGAMNGYVGKYYTSGRNNDQNEPAIAIDFNGKVPDIENAGNGQYQYAYFRG